MTGVPINKRQHKMLGRVIDGFEEKLTTSKWAQIAKCSQDTALRDIVSLVEHGILLQDAAGGRALATA
jgi:Fic family protein